MSTISNNAVEEAKGRGCTGDHNDSFKEQITQALAIKLNLKTNQQANERALSQLSKSNSLHGGLKQTLQARAAVYGKLLDPAWFCQNFELSAKVQTIRKRRVARSMLIGAPIFSAQLGVHELKKALTAGEDNLSTLDWSATGTAGQFVTMLSKASPQAVLRLLNRKQAQQIEEQVARISETLEYAQTVTNLVGEKSALNPIMNAVAKAFKRQRHQGNLNEGSRSIEIDTLLNLDKQGPRDDDEKVNLPKGQARGQYTKKRVCFLFQTADCTFQKCRYRHVCQLCQSTSHGSENCNQKRSSNERSRERKVIAEDGPSKPPHPRFHRDRARGAQT